MNKLIFFFANIWAIVALASPGVFEDPRVVRWSAQYLEGNFDLVLEEVEADLRGASPAASSPHIWGLMQMREGRLDEAVEALSSDAELKAALGRLPHIMQLDEDDEDQAMLAAYPPGSLGDESDVWVYYYLANAADVETRYDLVFDYCAGSLNTDPTFYSPVWDLAWLATHGDYRKTPEIISLVSGLDSAANPAAHLIQQTVRLDTDYAGMRQERTLLLEAFLESLPKDRFALRHLADTLNKIQSYELAEKYYIQAEKAYPFGRFWDYKKAAANSLKQERFADAEAQVRRSLTLRPSTKVQDEELLFATRWAEVLDEAGEEGKCRAILDAALEKWPDDQYLCARYARVEKAARPREAPGWARKAYAVDPDEYRELLVDCLFSAEENVEAWQIHTEWAPSVDQMSVPYINTIQEVAMALEQSGDAIALLETGLQRYQDSTWILRNLADAQWKAGQRSDALSNVKKSLTMSPTHSWAIGRYDAWITEQEEIPELILDEIQAMREKYSWEEYWWIYEKQARVAAGEVVDADFYEQAIKANPTRRWSYRKLLDYHWDAEDWESAAAVLKREEVAVKEGFADDIIEAAFDRAVHDVLLIRKGLLSREAIESNLEEWRAYEQMYGGRVSNYHYRYLAEVYRALDMRKKSAEALMIGVKSAPDDASIAFNLIRNGDYSELGLGNVMHRLERVAERNPYSGDSYKWLIEANTQWSGSPINALYWNNVAKDKAPDAVNPNHEAKCWGQLGDYQNDYRVRYGGKSGLYKSFISDRYISWFESARNSAQTNTRRNVEIDYESRTARITHEDGTVVIHQDHPLSGKRTLVQSGLAWMRAEYDESGSNMTALRSSSAEFLELDYDDSANIVAMRQSGGDEIAFSYNDMGKPTRITVAGLGALIVEYDENGEMESTESESFRPDEDVGHQMALKVTQAFQQMQEIAGRINVGYDELPESLPFEDPVETALFEKMNTQWEADDMAWVNSQIDLIRHLVDHLEATYDRGDQAQNYLNELFFDSSGASGFYSEDGDRLPKPEVFEALELQYELYQKNRPDGLSTYEWVDWNYNLLWLESQAEAVPAAAQLQVKINTNPLIKLSIANWLPRSDLSVSGFWRKFSASDFLPADPSDTVVNTVLWRENGDILAATSRGLAILRAGYWEWFVFNGSRKRYEASSSPAPDQLVNNVLSLAEDSDGRLWLGTADGLICLTGDYSETANVWNTSHDGLPSNRIQALAMVDDGMAVGTLKGLLMFSTDNLEMKPRLLLNGEDVQQIVRNLPYEEDFDHGYEEDYDMQEVAVSEESEPSVFWARAVDAVYSVQGEEVDVLYEGKVDSIAVDDQGDIFIISNGKVRVRNARTESSWKLVEGHQNILSAKEIFGVKPIMRPDDSAAMAILTDMGLAFYSDFSVESFRLPYADSEVEVYSLDTNGSSFVANTSSGIYLFERERAVTHSYEEVHDLLTAEDLGCTLVALGSRLDVIFHNEIDSMETVDWISATHLARAPDGGFYANDGSESIVHVSENLEETNYLFEISPTEGTDRYGDSNGWGRGPVRSMMVARDGTLWVAVGGSVFRWNEAEGLSEFSFFLDRELFPSRTQMIHNVYETLDGEITAVGSQEGHLSYQGVNMRGGRLVWDGEKFIRKDEEEGGLGRFVHSVTQIGTNKAIYGTGDGFMVQNGGVFQHYRGDLKDDISHQLASEKVKGNTLLGVKGALLGENTWLFGCTGGVLAYQDGNWFYPDRLNWMLPEPTLSQYGSRVVNAVETDSLGRIYVGTDHGLLVYDSGGGDALDFLVSNGQSQMAFAQIEVNKMRELGGALSDLLLQAEEAKGSDWVADYRASLDELNLLRAEVGAQSSARGAMAEISTGDEPSEVPSQGVRERLRARELKHEALMLEIQSAKASVGNALRVPPLQFEKWGAQLEDGQVAIQYVTSASALTLNIINNKGIQNIVRVEVDRTKLNAAVDRVVGSCYSEAQSRAPDFEEDEAGIAAIVNKAYDPTIDLAWLYGKLLRPVERYLTDANLALIVASGKLNYLPFEALVSKQEPVIRYAVEDYVFGYLPSLYLYDAAEVSSAIDGAHPLIVGNPTLDLDGAEAEALAVHQTLKTTESPLMREAATKQAVLAASDQSSLIHLATHAKLDAATPERSHIRLAGNERLEMIDILMMDLEGTDLVVLSCCESGLGATGLEYMTLAYSFAHAGAPTTIATLWEVNDGASKELMRRMYLYRAQGSDNFTALAEAKRSYLRKNEGEKRHPFYWSGYVGFGRP